MPPLFTAADTMGVAGCTIGGVGCFGFVKGIPDDESIFKIKHGSRNLSFFLP
jgi:hypothetical protein